MGCCGDNPQIEQVPAEGLPGDVLAIATWMGNRRERGRMTGRLYPRTGNGAQVYVDPRDAQAAPQLWHVIPQPQPRHYDEPDDADDMVIEVSADVPVIHAQGVHEIARALWPDMYKDVPGPIEGDTTYAPDFGAVLRLAANG